MLGIKIAMVPARLGSQRLKRKNLRELDGVPLITRAIRKCLAAGVFDEIWVNSESVLFKEIAKREGVRFHHRPGELAGHETTHEEYIYEFLLSRPCEYIFQVHSIAPLLTADQVRRFVDVMIEKNHDVQLSCIHEQIECALEDTPLNFSFQKKENSQDLKPIQRITWGITGWRALNFLQAHEAGRCATYDGKAGFFPLDPLSGHIIKTEEDLKIAQALLLVSR